MAQSRVGSAPVLQDALLACARNALLSLCVYSKSANLPAESSDGLGGCQPCTAARATSSNRSMLSSARCCCNRATRSAQASGPADASFHAAFKSTLPYFCNRKCPLPPPSPPKTPAAPTVPAAGLPCATPPATVATPAFARAPVLLASRERRADEEGRGGGCGGRRTTTTGVLVAYAARTPSNRRASSSSRTVRSFSLSFVLAKVVDLLFSF